MLTSCRLVLAFLCISCSLGYAQPSNPNNEIQRLMNSGQLDQAMQQVSALLLEKPRDVEARFLKGLILSEQKKINEATEVFLGLTQDFPELPEPHNNLAVLYAGQGHYEKARAALDLAIQTEPNYPIAYENLGDVYLQLAIQAYEKHLKLAGTSVAVPNKLSVIRTLIKTK